MPKRKKVAIFVGGEFIPSLSGAANRFHYLTQALQKHTDTDMIVILCDMGWSNPALISDEKFRTYVVHPELYKNINFLQEILAKENVDIIQFAILEQAVALGMPLSQRLGVPLVFEAHYDDYEFAKAIGTPIKSLRKIAYLQKTFGPYFDAVTALSDDDKLLAKNFNIRKNKITAIPSGANISEFPVNCFNARSKKIVFLGNLYFNINLKALQLIKKVIYPKLRMDGFRFTVVGDIAKKDKENLSGPGFKITGKRNNVSADFKNATFALAPVLSGSGIRIKILSYMNAGIPVITTTEGARGFPRKDLLIIVDDIAEYASTIKKLLNDPAKLERLSLSGRQYINDNISWEVIASRVSKQYDLLLKKDQKLKTRAVNIAKEIIFEDPPWIKEVIDGKRFKRNKPFVKTNCYLQIN